MSTLDESHLMHTYRRLPAMMDHGRGSEIWDTEGRRYLDGLAGIAVNVLGHAHPRLVAALQDQVAKLIHTSNYYHIMRGEELAAKLCQLSGLSKVFFCNSGMEANEGMLKLARKHGHTRNIDAPEVIVFEHAFHGRSLATLSATANPTVRKGFAPYVPGFVRLPMNDLAVLDKAASEHPSISAVMLETVQGEGGIHPLDADYLRGLRQLCDKHDWLLMLDEVQCGIGRTGKWFAYQWADILPDVMALAKGLGGGVPVGAFLAGPRAAELLQPGDHGTTFGGNPLAMRAGLTTLTVIEDEGLLDNATQIGNYLKQGLRDRLRDLDGVLEVRGQGLMIGVELDRPCGELALQALQAGLLLSVTADCVIRLVPPLNFSRANADELVDILASIIEKFLA